ncbi:hypothetical protein DUNSADRAFT_9904, partial [Dunaliella salina]
MVYHHVMVMAECKQALMKRAQSDPFRLPLKIDGHHHAVATLEGEHISEGCVLGTLLVRPAPSLLGELHAAMTNSEILACSGSPTLLASSVPCASGLSFKGHAQQPSCSSSQICVACLLKAANSHTMPSQSADPVQVVCLPKATLSNHL